jgi:hypothetical protein
VQWICGSTLIVSCIRNIQKPLNIGIMPIAHHE